MYTYNYYCYYYHYDMYVYIYIYICTHIIHAYHKIIGAPVQARVPWQAAWIQT